MVKVRIFYDREGCIGAGACAAMDPARFVMSDDGKADLIGAKQEDGSWVLDLDLPDIKKLKDAAEGCPVNVIKIKNLETGQMIVG